MHLVKTAFSAKFKPVTLSRYNKVTNFDDHFIVYWSLSKNENIDNDFSVFW